MIWQYYPWHVNSEAKKYLSWFRLVNAYLFLFGRGEACMQLFLLWIVSARKLPSSSCNESERWKGEGLKSRQIKLMGPDRYPGLPLLARDLLFQYCYSIISLLIWFPLDYIFYYILPIEFDGHCTQSMNDLQQNIC